jgi:hypothetical protein
MPCPTERESQGPAAGTTLLEIAREGMDDAIATCGDAWVLEVGWAVRE